MFDVATFLMRWLFVTKLIKDSVEIQTLPPQIYPPHEAWQVEEYLQQSLSTSLDASPYTHQGSTTYNGDFCDNPTILESVWKEHCIRNVLQYPPGTGRWQALEAYRVDLVHRLSQLISQANTVVLNYNHQINSSNSGASSGNSDDHDHDLSGSDDDDDSITHHQDDPYWDTDLDLLRDFENSRSSSTFAKSHDQHTNSDSNSQSAKLILSSTGTSVLLNETSIVDNVYSDNDTQAFDAANIERRHIQEPSKTQYDNAKTHLHSIRQYLPQLVSAVLQSSDDHNNPELSALPMPIDKLRQLLLNRCIDDPSFGIELCWLLEAQVGRTWKTLFEHRQESGRRLVVILPAEKAQVIAQIGQAKQQAFEWLQQVEQATAYGNSGNDRHHDEHTVVPYNQQHPLHRSYSSNTNAKNDQTITSQPSTQQQQQQQVQSDTTHTPILSQPRLPSSISLRRCKHFGDTMHFIDQLSELCLNLRHVHPSKRHGHLHTQLYEVNRRLRRRMVTKGEVTLDVSENYQQEWPTIHDLTLESIKYSVHFPLVPQVGDWPDGSSNDKDKLSSNWMDETNSFKVSRILNIVVGESRILSSRERCPFLVHLEVADTGLEGNDARLYAAGATQTLGATTSEAMGIFDTSKGYNVVEVDDMSIDDHDTEKLYPPVSPYTIPSELTESSSIVQSPSYTKNDVTVQDDNDTDYSDTYTVADQNDTIDSLLSRGGWQYDGVPYYEGDEYSYHYTSTSTSTTREVVNEQQLQRLHQDLQVLSYSTRSVPQPPPPPPPPPQPHTASSQQQKIVTQTTKSTMGSDLLNRIFGQPWIHKCREIRETSPFGHISGWRLASFITKAGEDIRREALVMQIISKMKHWFDTEIIEEDRPYLRPYTIMCVGGDAGLVECLSDSKSVDELKKKVDGYESLRSYFERAYGPPKKKRRMGFGPPSKPIDTKDGLIQFDTAQDNFLRSLVGYSLLCYIMQIKDRHNANILIDREGHIMHIDFGYVLGETPKMGKVPLFSERAPFKLSQDFWDVLGGWSIKQGGLGVRFCKMFEKAFERVSAHAEEIASLVESTMLTLDPDPRAALMAANGIRHRLTMRGPPGSHEQQSYIVDLVHNALTSWGTSTYDWLQRNMNGYQ